MKKIVLGIVAHVDSGKTTLSESLLYKSGIIKKLGRVDHGDAFMDSHSIERDRGITIFSNQAAIRYNDCEFTLVDTPGHVDFSAETERTFGVLDYAVLVISGTDGVQSHTETLWKLLKNYNIPVFIFINKMDISSLSKEDIINDIKNKLNHDCIDFSQAADDVFYENVSLCDETVMEKYLNDGIVSDVDISKMIKDRKVFPCYFGSALKSEGTDKLLEGLERYTIQPEYGSKFGARVFKISLDEQGERLTHLKITGGELKVKSIITSSCGNKEECSEKVNQIRIYSGTKFKTESVVTAGSVCTVTGLSKTYAGEGLGFEKDARAAYSEPVLSYSVQLPADIDEHTAISKFRILEQEDPQLHITWNERQREINFKIMGEVQLEVLKRIISERFNINVEFGQGSIAYKETIESPVEGIGHYEPLRHYAEVHLLLEPMPRGSGVVFDTDCSRDELALNWQRLVMTHLEEKTHIGVLTGSPITDIKITLIAGRAHLKHTEGGDFRQSTYRAVRHGLRCAKSVLLEPWYEFKIELPSEYVGRAMSDVQQMGGSFSPPENTGNMSILTGSAPVSEMRSYHNVLISYTKGKGKISCDLKGYEKCHNAQEVIESIGYDADSDTENTADSVFCAHGAGFVVNWKNVTEYKHIDTGLDFSPPDKEEVEERVNNYIGEIINDKELMRIFERTYGPIKRPQHEAFKLKKERTSTTVKSSKSNIATGGKEYLLVDGYNIVFAWEDLKEMAKTNLDLARNTLVNMLCNYQGFKQCEVILVFDAYKVKKNPGEIEKIHNISVVYTKEAETADTYIERVSHELSKKNKVMVATSDNLEQLIIFGNGAMRISAKAFHAEIDETQRQISRFLSEN